MFPFERLTLSAASFRNASLWHSKDVVRWAPLTIKNFQLLFIEEGTGALFVNEESFICSKGTCFVLEPHSHVWGWHEPLDPLRAFSCTFALEGWTRVSLWNNGASTKQNEFFVASAHCSQALHQRGDEVGSELARRLIEQLVLSLWDETHHSSTERDKVFKTLGEMVQQEPTRRWNVDDMAAQVGLSRAQFARRFRAHFSFSPLEFVTHVRLDQAQKLLRETSLSLDCVARMVGYNDGAFLSKQFKAAYGESPGVWRRRQKISEKFSSEPIDNQE